MLNFISYWLANCSVEESADLTSTKKVEIRVFISLLDRARSRSIAIATSYLATD